MYYACWPVQTCSCTSPTSTCGTTFTAHAIHPTPCGCAVFPPKSQTNLLNLSYPTMLLQLYRLNFSFAVLWVVFFIVSAISRRVTQLLVCLGFALVSVTTHKGWACGACHAP